MSTTPCVKTRQFMEDGTPNQFEWMLEKYDACLSLKANSKSLKPENIIKLDRWYQNDLPKKLKSRGKDTHFTHEELVQTIKWKLARGKFRPNLTNLVQMNTPRVAVAETRKAFRKLAKTEDVQGAVQALSNLKGVGPAMASAVLAAGAPHIAPYMADEVLLALPDTDCLDYTMKEYMRLVEHVYSCMERLNAQGGKFTPHDIELAVWSFYIANDLKPELLENMPKAVSNSATSSNAAPSNQEEKEVNGTENKNGNNGDVNGVNNEDSNMSSVQDEESLGSINSVGAEESKNQEEGKEVNGKDKETEISTSNGTTSSTSAPESKENGNGMFLSSEVEAAIPTIPFKATDTVVTTTTTTTMQEEDTSDSTKENIEATSCKLPTTDINNEASNDNNQTSEPEEPSAKKLKTEETSHATLTA